MEFSYKCMPVSALPYNDLNLAVRMMVRLYAQFPYLPFFPNIDAKDTIIQRTFGKLQGLTIKNDSIVIDINSEKFLSGMAKMDQAYNNPSMEALEKYKFASPFLDRYLQIIKREKPKQTVVNFIGPFTFSQMIQADSEIPVLADKLYRKLIIQVLTLKTLWIIYKIYQACPETKTLILFEEPKLNEFGVLKKENEAITKDVVLNVYTKLFQNLHAADALVGVQSFQKCDWQIPIEAGADLISFDAYNNQSSLTIIPDTINEFLAKEGIINWGIVPVMTEAMVKSLNIGFLQDRFANATKELAESGVKIDLIYKNATVSTQGDVSKLPLIFAEKALILSTQLGEKVAKGF